MRIFQVRVILGGNFPCGNCPGGSYPGWEFSLMGVFRVGIVRGGIIRVGILLVGVFLVPQNSSFSSIRLFLVAFLKIISDFELFVLVFVYSREKVLAMKKHFY